MTMTLEKNGYRIVRAIDRATDITLGIILCIMLLFGGYSLWDSKQVYETADAGNYVAYRPDDGENDGFSELRRLNPEVFAWLTVNDSPIDYPVTQAENNEKYVNTDARGEYSLSGSIFLDCRNSPDFDDFNSIIYGHHMEEQKMFGSLSDFADRTYFDTHREGSLYFGGKNYGVDFFALVLTDAYDKNLFSPAIAGEDMRRAYLNYIFSQAMWTRDLPLDTGDQIIVLTTCTSAITNGRYMLFGKLGDELPLPEQGEEQGTDGLDLQLQIQKLTRVSVWVWLFAIVLLVGLLVVVQRRSKREKMSRKEEEL